MSSERTSGTASLHEYKVALDVTITEFDASNKKAIGYVDKYMKRGAASDNTTAEQKVDDFKRAAAEFNTSGKSILKKLRQLSLDLDAAASAADQQQQQQPAPAPGTVATTATGGAPDDAERDAWRAKEETLMKELSAVKEAKAKLEADLAAAQSSTQQQGAVEDKEKAAAAAAAAQVAAHEQQLQQLNDAHATALTEAQKSVQDITSERDQLLNTSNQLRAQIQQMDNAFRNMQETAYREKDSLNRAVRSLQDDLVKKEREKDDIRREVDQQRELVAAAKKDEELALVAKSALEQRLEFAVHKREGDFVAFEQATRDHERDIHEWQGKYSAAMLQVSRLKEDATQLQQRLMDDHLREHVRVLQAENNQLREDRVKLLQSAAKDPNAFRILTSALQDSIDALNRDKATLSDQIAMLIADVDLKEKHLHDEETRHMVALANVQRQNQELEQRVRHFEAQEAASKRRLVPDDLIQGLIDAAHAKKERRRRRLPQVKDADDVHHHNDDGLDDADVDDGSSRGSRSTSSQPEVERVIETWERSVQVDDIDRLHLEKELIRLRADNQELADDVARLQQNDQKQRMDMHDKLIQQMKGFESQVDTLERETKLRAFKVAKLQQANEALEDTTRAQQKELEVTQRALALSEHNHQDANKRYLSLEMENSSLDAKIRVLRREIEELHQQASETTLAKHVATHQQQQQQHHNGGLVVPRIPIQQAYDGNGSSTTPRGSTATNSLPAASQRYAGGGAEGYQQHQQHSPPSARATSAASSSTSSANAARQDAIRKLDQFMLDLHQQTVNLDIEYQRATAEAEDSAAKRSQRSAYLEASRPFWEKERHKRGPNGEPPAEVMRSIDATLRGIHEEDMAASRQLQLFYQSIAKKREQVLSATTKITEKRNTLLKQL